MGKALEAAVNVPRGNYLGHEDYVRGVLAAFLDTAAGDEDTCRVVGRAAFYATIGGMGKAAILKMKVAL